MEHVLRRTTAHAILDMGDRNAKLHSALAFQATSLLFVHLMGCAALPIHAYVKPITLVLRVENLFVTAGTPQILSLAVDLVRASMQTTAPASRDIMGQTVSSLNAFLCSRMTRFMSVLEKANVKHLTNAIAQPVTLEANAKSTFVSVI
mmetsp:Transcript_6671/g.24966  ORF Transcript_6671/g.24966 Transcript_6671/m.24966 type:complete len:148 (-) Transcript_6671:60-503(-)